MKISNVPAHGDACPKCFWGTVEVRDNGVACSGECGAVWEKEECGAEAPMSEEEKCLR